MGFLILFVFPNAWTWRLRVASAALFIFVASMEADSAVAQTVDAPAVAGQLSGTGAHIRGTVRDESGNAIAGARIEAHGPVDAVATSDAGGSYDLRIPPGVYRIVVSKNRFETATQNALTVVGTGAVDDVTLSVLQSGLEVIGGTSTTTTRNHFNTTPAAVQTLSTQDFQDQGQESLARMLAEIPGVSTTTPHQWTAGGSLVNTPNTWVNPQIRGAMSYETAQTFDGFPLLSGDASAGFNVGLLTTVGLSGIDIVKGPGADSTTINSAVGGTINYRSLNPTPRHQFTASVSTDGYGGSIWKALDSGTLGRLGYALGYSAANSPGPFGDKYSTPWIFNDDNATVNGMHACGSDPNSCSGAPWPGNAANASNPIYRDWTTPFYFCCRSPKSTSDVFTETGKLVYHLTPYTDDRNATIDVAYFRTQLFTDYGGYRGAVWGGTFSPPAGYTTPAGGIAPGTSINNLLIYDNDVMPTHQTQNIFETNLRAKIGPGFLHVGYLSLYQFEMMENVPWATPHLFQAYGSIPLLAPGATTPTIYTFTGQTVPVSNNYYWMTSQWQHNRDWVVDYRVPIGPNSVDVSWNQSTVSPSTGSSEYYPDAATYSQSATTDLNECTTCVNGNYGLLKQTNNEFRLSSSLQISPQLSALASVYYNQYINHVNSLAQPSSSVANPNPTGLAAYLNSFSDGFNNALTPRVGLTYRQSPNASIRFSAGGATVPAPILALGGGGGIPGYDTVNGWYTQSVSPIGLKPETSFGYDIGADVRLPKNDILFSSDLYSTTLQNQFITTTSLAGTYQDNLGHPNAPLYTTQLRNANQSRYEGVELSVRRDVPHGFGFQLSGYLQRGYTYNIPANFYVNPVNGNPQNLSIIPGINYFNGWNSNSNTGGIANGSALIEPYSGGYGEISYRWGKDSLARFGATYYGSYNTYFEPAFFLLTASVRYGITNHLALQLTGDNLGGVATNPFNGGGESVIALHGVPAPLSNGTESYTPYLSVGPRTVRFELIYK
jgi:hypothetical protein